MLLQSAVYSENRNFLPHVQKLGVFAAASCVECWNEEGTTVMNETKMQVTGNCGIIILASQ